LHKKRLLEISISNLKKAFFKYDVPGGIRTPDRTLRRRMLYPAELLGHSFSKQELYYHIVFIKVNLQPDVIFLQS
jgi:hypothetical protein